MGHAGIGIIHPSTAPGDCPGGRGFGQEFDSPHLHQKLYGHCKKSINSRVCEFSPILEKVGYYKLTTKTRLNKKHAQNNSDRISDRYFIAICL